MAVKEFLAPYLPDADRRPRTEPRYRWEHDRPQSIGKVHGFHGNFGIAARAYTYIRSQGARGPARRQRERRC